MIVLNLIAGSVCGFFTGCVFFLIIKQIFSKEILYLAPESWGDPDQKPMEIWEELIPLDEEEASETDYYDWFVSDNGELLVENHHNKTDYPLWEWVDYRKSLLEELEEL